MAKNGRDVNLRQVLSTGRIQRNDDQLRRDHDERERRRRLADIRAALSEDALATLKRRAEEALAKDGVARTHLGYEVLVKLKLDELLEREDLSADICVSQGPRDPAAVESSIFWEMNPA
jgi:hypothetical protein